MLSAHELWTEIEHIVDAEGLRLFDIDKPAQLSGTLRVYIAQPSGGGEGVTVDLCERVSKRIAAHPRLEWVRDRYMLEVSSPGINRRLQRPEHFAGAIGERVRLVVSEPGGGEATLVGKITACSGGQLSLSLENSTEVRKVALEDIQKARVDYLFE